MIRSALRSLGIHRPTVERLADSLANAWDFYLGDGVADLRHTPSRIIDEGPQRAIHHYVSERPARSDRSPVLFVPPLAAPATCFDLRRGCSLAEHMTALGYPTYLVDYGPISFEDRALGLEHWIEDVLPNAIRTVSEHADGAQVHTLAWSLGGVMTPLAAAADPKLPLASMSLIGSPFDFERIRLLGPIRVLAKLTRGALVTSLYRMLGGAPAPLVSLGFQATAIQRLIGRPLFLARHLDDRDTLAQVQAVDEYMANMFAYPGRTFGQLYHRFFFVNDLVDGKLELTDHTIDLAECRVPVLSVASPDDLLAPEGACFAVADLLPNSPEVRLESAPGGHLGVLTGRVARDTTWAHVDQFIAHNEPRTRVADTLL